MNLKHCFMVLLSIGFAAADLPYPNWVSLRRSKRELVDLHNGEFCVDVSTFGDIIYDPEPREKCDSTFEKVCETKNEKICSEVTEIQCEVVPYTECEMIMEVVPYRSYKTVTKQYNKMECEEGMDTVQHTKMMPECRNVTKQNCITKWETDENGKQVWAGNEACEPVTWRECQLVPRQVDFKVPKIECAEGEEVPYSDLEEDEKETMTTSMLCKVLNTTNCQPIVSTKCADISYQECRELPTEVCETEDVQIPRQEKEHKKKCLLPDDGNLPAAARASQGVAPSDANAGAAPDNNLEASESRRNDVSAQKPQQNYLASPPLGSARGGRRLKAQQQKKVFNQQQQHLQFQRQQQHQQQQLRLQQHQQQVRQAKTFRGHATTPTFQAHPQHKAALQQQQFQQRTGRQFLGTFTASQG